MSNIYNVRTAKEIFEEELSGEPLHQDVVIEAIQIAQMEILNNLNLILDNNKLHIQYIKNILNLKD